MGKLSRVGTVKISRSEKSFHITYQSPASVFKDHLFVSRKGLRELDKGDIAEINLFLLEPDPSGEPAENKELRG